MSVVTIFSASFCHGESVAEMLTERLGYYQLSNDRLVRVAAEQYGLSTENLQRSMHGPVSVFSKLASERERNVACLRAALAEQIMRNRVVFHGFAGLLLPLSLTHVLRVCLVASREYRTKLAMERKRVSERKARHIIRQDDTERGLWTRYLFDAGPYDGSLYDLLIPMQAISTEEAAQVISDNIGKPALEFTSAAEIAMEDFLLASRVNVALSRRGHDVDVFCAGGLARISLNKYVLRLGRLGKELEALAMEVPGVEQVEIRLSQRAARRKPKTYPPVDLEQAPRYLLVDDEIELVRTLSERLRTRRLDSAVAYDGEEALSILQREEPGVMVLDLKMPGIEGLEVLRRVRKKHPNVEVIILTGHGSKTEEALAMALGAFAYLDKPADVDLLASTMKSADRKARALRDSEESLEESQG